MNFVLDSDILIYFLKGRPEIVDKLTSCPIDMIFTTRINYTELLYGAYNSAKIEQNLAKITGFLSAIPVLEFDEKAGLIFAQDKAILKRLGIMIADMDLMIASITKAHQFALVTNNHKHFERIDNLKIDRWI
jgi:predicted nucleic acid-binding protein